MSRRQKIWGSASLTLRGWGGVVSPPIIYGTLVLSFVEFLNFNCYNFMIFLLCHHQQSVLPKGRSFTAITGIRVAVFPKGWYSTANSGTKPAVLPGMNRCGSFSFSAPHSLFSILTNLKRSEKITRGPTWR